MTSNGASVVVDLRARLLAGFPITLIPARSLRDSTVVFYSRVIIAYLGVLFVLLKNYILFLPPVSDGCVVGVTSPVYILFIPYIRLPPTVLVSLT